MDRKNKVWLIVLAILLVLAIAAVIVINGKLSTSRESLAAVNMQLATQQESYEALNGEFESMSADYAQLQESSANLETELAQANEDKASLETQLTEAESRATEAETRVATLETELNEATSANAALESQLAEATSAQAQPTTATDAEPVAEPTTATNAEPVAEPTAATNAEPVAEPTTATDAEPVAEPTAATDAEPEQPAADPQPSIEDMPIEVELTREERAAYAAEAEDRIADLTAAIERTEMGIVDLGGELAPIPVDAAEPADGAKYVATPSGAKIPEVLGDAIGERIAQINDEIDAILNAEEGSMSDEEKIAALTALDVEMAGYVRQLNDALALVAVEDVEKDASADSIAALEAELAQTQARVDELTESIAASERTIQELETQLAELTAQSESDNALAASQIEALNARIAEEEQNVAELSSQLEAANAELQACIAELEAYRLDRELVEGDAYTASTLGDVLKVADGVRVEWSYTNDSISGNAVVLSILLDGEELYRSGRIQPGESLEGITLNRALESGSYEAVAVMSVYDAEGTVVSATRVPVTIQVG